MKKTTSNKDKISDLIDQIIKNSNDDRSTADLYIRELVEELEDTDTPVTINSQAIQKFLEVKIKANETLVKAATTLLKREENLSDKKEDEGEDLDSFVGNLYNKFSDQTVKTEE